MAQPQSALASRAAADAFWAISKSEAEGRVTESKVFRCSKRGWFANWFGCSGDGEASEFCSTTLARYSVLQEGDVDAAHVAELRRSNPSAPFLSLGPQLDRAIGSFVSMAIGDALGAPLEFRPVRYEDDKPIVTGFNSRITSSFGLHPGQWTDDSSMGACIADSLLWCRGFDPYDMKNRFACWWYLGYNNSSRLAPQARSSVGLGGNISMALSEFMEKGTVYTQEGDANTSGNGSLMRNAAVPVYHHKDLELALTVARKQSLLTHQGTEAAECCAALTHLVFLAINNPELSKLDLIQRWQQEFRTEVRSVSALVRGDIQLDKDNMPMVNRDWRWGAPQYQYSPDRSRDMPGYVGSYAMDALAMALHCVWKTSTYEAAMLMSANRCGDADSVTAICGQIAGALYGEHAIPRDWVAALNQWDGDEFAVKGWKLFFQSPLR